MRLHGWEERLVNFIESRRDTPFEWGSNDCATFAAAAIESLTGADLIGVPRWTDAMSAARVVKALGGMAAIADARLPRVDPSEAWRGDIGLVEAEGRESFGVIYPPWVITPGGAGIVMNRIKDCRAAWGVR